MNPFSYSQLSKIKKGSWILFKDMIDDPKGGPIHGYVIDIEMIGRERDLKVLCYDEESQNLELKSFAIDKRAQLNTIQVFKCFYQPIKDQMKFISAYINEHIFK